MKNATFALLIALTALTTTGCGMTPREHAMIWMGAVGAAANTHQQQTTKAPAPPRTTRCYMYAGQLTCKEF